jgi:hypothetical protein
VHCYEWPGGTREGASVQGEGQEGMGKSGQRLRLALRGATRSSAVWAVLRAAVISGSGGCDDKGKEQVGGNSKQRPNRTRSVATEEVWRR